MLMENNYWNALNCCKFCNLQILQFKVCIEKLQSSNLYDIMEKWEDFCGKNGNSLLKYVGKFLNFLNIEYFSSNWHCLIMVRTRKKTLLCYKFSIYSYNIIQKSVHYEMN